MGPVDRPFWVESGHCQYLGRRYHLVVAENLPKTVGLGGDGDEIAAIGDVERAFGVKLDYGDAPHWVTAGDVFASLQKALREDERSKPELWDRFAIALSGETGVNPQDIEGDSPLLSQSRLWVHVSNASAAAWMAAATSMLVLVAWALL